MYLYLCTISLEDSIPSKDLDATIRTATYNDVCGHVSSQG